MRRQREAFWKSDSEHGDFDVSRLRDDRTVVKPFFQGLVNEATKSTVKKLSWIQYESLALEAVPGDWSMRIHSMGS